MVDYYNVTTNTGDAEITAAIASNTKLAITHIAFGDGNGAVPTPTKTRTSLVREVHRQAVNKYERHPTNANWIVIETIIPSNIGGFTIREMGVIANGKLISHGSHAPFEKVADSTGVSEYRLKFTLNIKDGNVVSITLDQSLIYASQAWVDENYIPRDEIIDNLTTDDAKKPLSAAQGKVLQNQKLGKDESAISANKLLAIDDRTLKPSSVPLASIKPYFVTEYGLNNALDSGNYGDFLAINTYLNESAGKINGLFFDKSSKRILHYQAGIAATEWGTAHELAYTNSNISGNAASASKLQTTRTVQFSGAATGSFGYDGSGNSSCILTLANSGIAASTYGSNLKIPVITVNQKGLLTGVSEQIIPIVDDLSTGGSNKLLSAEQGKKLQDDKVDKAFIRKTFGGTYAPIVWAGYNFNDIMPGDYIFHDVSIATVNPPPFIYASVYCEGVLDSNEQRFVIARDYFTGQIATRGRQNNSWSEWQAHALKTDNVASATKLQTARNIALTGAVSGNVNFDGSGNITINTVDNFSIGVNQTWQNVTANRVVRVVYTNTTGRSIQIFINANLDNGYITLNGERIFVADQDAWGWLSLIIPAGNTYKIEGSGDQRILAWLELR